jgi:hypothetical protein
LALICDKAIPRSALFLKKPPVLFSIPIKLYSKEITLGRFIAVVLLILDSSFENKIILWID